MWHVHPMINYSNALNVFPHRLKSSIVEDLKDKVMTRSLNWLQHPLTLKPVCEVCDLS